MFTLSVLSIKSAVRRHASCYMYNIHINKRKTKVDEAQHRKWRISLGFYGGYHASHDVLRGDRPNPVYLFDFPGDRRRAEHNVEGIHGWRGCGAHRWRRDHQHQELPVPRTRATRPTHSPFTFNLLRNIGTLS